MRLALLSSFTLFGSTEMLNAPATGNECEERSVKRRAVTAYRPQCSESNVKFTSASR